MTFANLGHYAAGYDAVKNDGFFATLFRALRAGPAVRTGRIPAGSEPLYFHANPRAF